MPLRDAREITQEFDRLDPEKVASGETASPGMTYEQGVEAALMWVLGNSNDKPLDE